MRTTVVMLLLFLACCAAAVLYYNDAVEQLQGVMEQRAALRMAIE